jgi:hypothetical protein
MSAVALPHAVCETETSIPYNAFLIAKDIDVGLEFVTKEPV